MPNVKSRKGNRNRRTRAYAPDSGGEGVKIEKKPVRGVALKTVSRWTMLFAVVCLAAFAAGRPPVSAAGSSQAAKKERPVFLGLRTAAYQVKDLAKAKAWYANVLGIQPYFDQPFYVGFNVGGYELGLTPVLDAGQKRPAAGIAYWGVEDARGAYQRLLDLGATQQEPVQDVGEGILIGAVYDPFGNVLGVIQNPNFKATGN